jgi:hypothetical protein
VKLTFIPLPTDYHIRLAFDSNAVCSSRVYIPILPTPSPHSRVSAFYEKGLPSISGEACFTRSPSFLSFISADFPPSSCEKATQASCDLFIGGYSDIFIEAASHFSFCVCACLCSAPASDDMISPSAYISLILLLCVYCLSLYGAIQYVQGWRGWV